MRYRTAAVALGLVVLAAGAPAQQLPEGEGRALLVEGCVQCHDLTPVLTQRKPPEAWHRTVHEMVWRGAPLYPGEAAVVAEYLSSAFGEGMAGAVAAETAAGTEEDAQSLPAGEGRELLQRACVECHDLAKTTAARKSAAEWRHSVGLMAALGARLSPIEQETLARYLSETLGGDQ